MVAGRAGGYGGGDGRQQDQSPPHSLPRRPGPSSGLCGKGDDHAQAPGQSSDRAPSPHRGGTRSEEHTSELQSQSNLVCRLLLAKKKTDYTHSVPPSKKDTASLKHAPRVRNATMPRHPTEYLLGRQSTMETERRACR